MQKKTVIFLCQGDGEIDISLKRAYAIRPYGKWGNMGCIIYEGIRK